MFLAFVPSQGLFMFLTKRGEEMKEREKLVSLTKKDFRWDYFRGSGKGGQKRNKTSSGVRCTHEESGAVGQSDDTRQQGKNKIIAFKRMSQTKEFQSWLKLECARVTGALKEIEEKVEREMKFNTKVEVKENGKWV